MKVGMTLQLTSFGGKPDSETYQDELSLVDMAEGLGFDSVWALDHHFTGYVMSPDPTQLLSYVAGGTRRVQLGTAVIVLPWHDPVEIAEKIALLDVVLRRSDDLRLRPRRRDGRVQRLPYPDGGSARPLRRKRDYHPQRPDPGEFLVRRQVLQDSGNPDPAAADLPSGRTASTRRRSAPSQRRSWPSWGLAY